MNPGQSGGVVDEFRGRKSDSAATISPRMTPSLSSSIRSIRGAVFDSGRASLGSRNELIQTRTDGASRADIPSS